MTGVAAVGATVTGVAAVGVTLPGEAVVGFLSSIIRITG